MKRGIVIAAVLVGLQALAVVAYLGIGRWRSGSRPVAFRFERFTTIRMAPELELERVDGTRVHLSELRGKPVLVHFWATWCPPCREELPGLLAAADRDQVALLAISVDEDWQVVNRFFGDRALPAAVVRDGTNGWKQWEVGTLPDTFVVDRDGRVTHRMGGSRDWRSPGARALLDELGR